MGLDAVGSYSLTSVLSARIVKSDLALDARFKAANMALDEHGSDISKSISVAQEDITVVLKDLTAVTSELSDVSKACYKSTIHADEALSLVNLTSRKITRVTFSSINTNFGQLTEEIETELAEALVLTENRLKCLTNREHQVDSVFQDISHMIAKDHARADIQLYKGYGVKEASVYLSSFAVGYLGGRYV